VGVALVVLLLLLPVAGALRPLDRWLPTTLASAPVQLLEGTHRLPWFLPTIGATVAASAAALALAALRLGTREI